MMHDRISHPRWYPTDIGGGSVDDGTPHALARIPLRWMIRECFKCNTGIRFHAELLKRTGLDPSSLHPVVRDRPPPLKAEPVHATSVAEPVNKGTEEDHEVRDALAPLYDQLVLAPYWWALELIPTRETIVGPSPDHKEIRAVTYVLSFASCGLGILGAEGCLLLAVTRYYQAELWPRPTRPEAPHAVLRAPERQDAHGGAGPASEGPPLAVSPQGAVCERDSVGGLSIHCPGPVSFKDRLRVVQTCTLFYLV